jgi:hypothetical protein
MSTLSMTIYQLTILRKRGMRLMYGILMLSRGVGWDLPQRRAITQRESGTRCGM